MIKLLSELYTILSTMVQYISVTNYCSSFVSVSSEQVLVVS